MELGKKIARLRKRNKITQAQLAEYLAVQPQTVSRWEAEGGTPDVMLLPKIAMFFGVSMDELFGMTDMVQIENLVYKYSVLRDEKSYEEVMRSIDGGVENIEEQLLEIPENERQELRQRREQLLAWKVHIFIQKARNAMDDAEKQLDELVEEITEPDNPLFWPLRLQKQQLRIQRGEAKKTIYEAKEYWEHEQSLDALYCYMMGLLEIQDGVAILALWEQNKVQELVGTVVEQTESHWLTMFSAARIEQKLELFNHYLSQFSKWATEQSVFDAEWELFLLYDELDMQQEKLACGEKLLQRMEKLHFNEYIKDVYTKKIEES